MSEKMEVALKDEDKKLLQSVIEKVTQAYKDRFVAPELEHEAKRNHSSIEEIEACPNCSEKFRLKDYNDKKKAALEAELRPAILKEVKEKLKSKQLLTCDGCGEIVEKTLDECPTCKGTHAH